MVTTAEKSRLVHSGVTGGKNHWEIESSGQTESSWFRNLQHPLRFKTDSLLALHLHFAKF